MVENFMVCVKVEVDAKPLKLQGLVTNRTLGGSFVTGQIKTLFCQAVRDLAKAFSIKAAEHTVTFRSVQVSVSQSQRSGSTTYSNNLYLDATVFEDIGEVNPQHIYSWQPDDWDSITAAMLSLRKKPLQLRFSFTCNTRVKSLPMSQFDIAPTMGGPAIPAPPPGSFVERLGRARQRDTATSMPRFGGMPTTSPMALGVERMERTRQRDTATLTPRSGGMYSTTSPMTPRAAEIPLTSAGRPTRQSRSREMHQALDTRHDTARDTYLTLRNNWICRLGAKCPNNKEGGEIHCFFDKYGDQRHIPLYIEDLRSWAEAVSRCQTTISRPTTTHLTELLKRMIRKDLGRGQSGVDTAISGNNARAVGAKKSALGGREDQVQGQIGGNAVINLLGYGFQPPQLDNPSILQGQPSFPSLPSLPLASTIAPATIIPAAAPKSPPPPNIASSSPIIPKEQSAPKLLREFLIWFEETEVTGDAAWDEDIIEAVERVEEARIRLDRLHKFDIAGRLGVKIGIAEGMKGRIKEFIRERRINTHAQRSNIDFDDSISSKFSLLTRVADADFFGDIVDSGATSRQTSRQPSREHTSSRQFQQPSQLPASILVQRPADPNSQMPEFIPISPDVASTAEEGSSTESGISDM